MITMQPQLSAPVIFTWSKYTPVVMLDWLHGERRELISEDQVAPSRDPISVIPSAVFSIAMYQWDKVEW